MSSRGSNRNARPDSRLPFVDQALFSTLRATGDKVVIQALWVYEHSLDLDKVKRFHHNLGSGLLGRRIERSPLPFARDRWVSYPAPEIDIGERARPRTELSSWVDESARMPIDPEMGPSWHLGVQPFTDGSTAISLVVSHCLIDGLGCVLAITEAIMGKTRDLGYPPPRSRTWLGAVVQDAGQTAQGAPEVVRALVAVVKLACHSRKDVARSRVSRPLTVHGDDDGGVVPGVMIHIDNDDWDARTKALGGTNYSLAAGFVAKLGERMGRRRADDGAVTLQIPLTDRTEGDTRANALSYVRVNVDPSQVTTDLSDIRSAIRQAFKAHREEPDQSLPVERLAPLIPFTPRRVLKRVADMAFAYADLPVGCSNLGDIASVAGNPDGTEAEYVSARGVQQNITRQRLEQTLGQLNTVSWRIGSRYCINVLAYQPDRATSKAALRDLVADTLAEFDLAGVIE